MSKSRRWIERPYKSRNVLGKGEEEHLPIVYQHLWAWICHYPPDGDWTSAMEFTKEAAFRKWEALTMYYERELCS